MDRRVRALAWVIRRLAPAERLSRFQARNIPDNFLTRYQLGAAAPGVSLEDKAIPGPGGDLPVRLYRAAGSAVSQTVVYLHGGGFVLGGPRMGDWLCSNVALRAGAVVVSVDYRLAPAAKFPAAVEDAHAALTWAASEFPGPLAVMGESAGANLSAVACLLARDRGGPAIGRQALLYPPVDMTDESGSAAAPHSAFLTLSEARLYRQHYLGSADPSDFRASPLLASDHSDLPPALIQAGEHDPLLGGAVRYAAALRQAGVPVRFTEYVGMPHGFLNFPNICRAAPQALSELCAFLHE